MFLRPSHRFVRYNDPECLKVVMPLPTLNQNRKEDLLSEKAKKCVLKSLRWVATAGIVLWFLTAVAPIDNYREMIALELKVRTSVFCLLVIFLVWSPVYELSKYFSLRIQRHALEERRKIDELAIVELNDPVGG